MINQSTFAIASVQQRDDEAGILQTGNLNPFRDKLYARLLIDKMLLA